MYGNSNFLFLFLFVSFWCALTNQNSNFYLLEKNVIQSWKYVSYIASLISKWKKIEFTI